MTGSDEGVQSGWTSAPMSPAQSRAARGLLGWSEADLAAKVGLDEAFGAGAFEAGRSDPASGQVEALRSALMTAGAVFSNGDSPGVRLERRDAPDEGTRADALTTENDREPQAARIARALMSKPGSAACSRLSRVPAQQAAGDHVVGRPVHRLDAAEGAAPEAEHREGLPRAPHHAGVARRREAGDLQLVTALVAPEPGHGRVDRGPSGETGREAPALVDGVLHRSDAHGPVR